MIPPLGDLLSDHRRMGKKPFHTACIRMRCHLAQACLLPECEAPVRVLQDVLDRTAANVLSSDRRAVVEQNLRGMTTFEMHLLLRPVR